MTLSELLVKISADVSGYTQGVDAVKSKTSELSGAADKANSSFAGIETSLNSIGSSMTRLGATMTAAITVPLAGVAVAALKVSSDLQQATIAFTTMMKSSVAAREHLEQLRAFAMQTPFEFTDLVTASKRLQALGFAAADVIPVMKSIGNAAAALGTGAEGIDRISLALGQMRSKGKVSAEEMKQLAEAGIPAWQMLADAMSKSEKRVVTVAEAMKRAQNDIIDGNMAVNALLEGMDKKFGGLMEQQMTTVAGRWSNLQDQAKKVLSDIGDALEPLAKQGIDALSGMLAKVGELVEGFKSLDTSTQGLILTMGGLAAAAGPGVLVMGQFAQSINEIWKLANGLAGVLGAGGLGVALLSITALATGAAIGLKQLADETASLHTLDAEFDKFIDNTAKNAKDYAKSQEIIDKALENGLITKQKHAAAMKQLEGETNKGLGFGFGKITIAKPGEGSTSTDPAKDAEKAAKAAEKAAQRISKAYADLGVESKKAQDARKDLALLWKEFEKGNISAGALTHAIEAAGNSLRKMGEASKWKVELNAYGAYELQRALEGVNQEFEVGGRTVRVFSVGINELARQMPVVTTAADSLARSWQDMFNNMALQPEMVERNIRLLIPTIEQLNKGLGASQRGEGLNALGIPDHKETEKAADAAIQAYDAIATAADSTATEITQAWLKMTEAQINAGRNLSASTVADYINMRDALKTPLQKVIEFGTEIDREVRKAFDRVARNIADSFGKGFTEGLKSIGADLGKGFLEIFTRQLIKPLEDLAAKAAVKISTTLFAGMLGLGTSVAGGAMTTAIPLATSTAGVLAPGLFTPGYEAAKAAAGIGGTAAKGASSVASTASGLMGALNPIGAIGSAVSAVSSIIGNFQNAKMEKTMNAIEESTRYTKIYTGEQSDSILETLHQIRNRLSDFTATYGFSMLVDLTVEMKDAVIALGERLGNLGQLGSAVTAEGVVVTGGGLAEVVTSISDGARSVVDAINRLGDSIAKGGGVPWRDAQFDGPTVSDENKPDAGAGSYPPASDQAAAPSVDKLKAERVALQKELNELIVSKEHLGDFEAGGGAPRLSKIAELESQIRELDARIGGASGPSAAETATTPPSSPANINTAPLDYGTIQAILTVNQTIIEQTTRLIEALQAMGGIGGAAEQVSAAVPQDAASIVSDMLKSGASRSDIENKLMEMGSSFEWAADGSIKFSNVTVAGAAAVQSSLGDLTDSAALASTSLANLAQGINFSEWQAPKTEPGEGYPGIGNGQGISGFRDMFEEQRSFKVDPDLAYWMDNYGLGGTQVPAAQRSIVIQNNTFKSREDLDYLVHLAKAQL